NLGVVVYSTQYTIISGYPAVTRTITTPDIQGRSLHDALPIFNLFNTLSVSVSTFSSSAYTTPQDTFAIGQTVFVKAAITLQDGTVVSSGSVPSFTITGTSVATTPVTMTTFSSSLSAWTGSYTIISTDQLGSQAVTVSAADTSGNTGSGTHQTTIQAPQVPAATPTSPSPNSVFNRGETVTISAKVTSGVPPRNGAIGPQHLP